jgi:anion transporter
MGKFQRLTAGLVLISAVILYFVPPPGGMSREIIRCSALLLFAIGFWATGIIPEYLTALIFLLIAVISKLAPASVVFSGFYSAALWLVFGGLVIAVGVEHTGLGRRMAHRFLGVLGTSYAGTVSGVVLVAMLLDFIMPSTMGRVVLLVPIVVAMAERLNFPQGSPGRNGMVMAVSLACFVPSCAILPSNVVNMVLAGASESIYGVTFTYANYLKLHFPVIGLMKGLAIVLLTCIFFPARIRSTPVERHQRAVPLSKSERVLALILAGTLLLWGTDFLHGISPGWVALSAALVCLLPFNRLLPVGAFQGGINFGPLFYVAGVLGLGAVVAKTGLGDIFGNALLKLMNFEPGHHMRNFISLVILFTCISPVTTVPGFPAVMTPLCSRIATVTGFPLETVLMTQVIGYCNLILPYQLPPLVVAMQLGGVKAAHGARLTIALATVSTLILMPANYFWWSLLGLF